MEGLTERKPPRKKRRIIRDYTAIEDEIEIPLLDDDFLSDPDVREIYNTYSKVSREDEDW